MTISTTPTTTSSSSHPPGQHHCQNYHFDTIDTIVANLCRRTLGGVLTLENLIIFSEEKRQIYLRPGISKKIKSFKFSYLPQKLS